MGSIKGTLGAQACQSRQICAAGHLQQQGFCSVRGGVTGHHITPILFGELGQLPVTPLASGCFRSRASNFSAVAQDR